MSFAAKADAIREKGLLLSLVSMAVAKGAVAVINEDPQTTNHAERLAWAKQALRGPEQMAERMLWGVLASSDVTKDSTDQEIETAVNGVITSYGISEA